MQVISTLVHPDLRSFDEAASSGAALRRFITGIPGVDQAGVEARVRSLAARSITGEAKSTALDLAIRMVDLTTLEGTDTPARVRSLCAQARRPDVRTDQVPAVAAVCVYPDMVRTAVEALAGSEVLVASAATAFPSGRSYVEVKVAETRRAVSDGAGEIDMVIDRGALLTEDYNKVFTEILAVKQACGTARLKVILETGELASYDNIRRASWLALMAGADFIKTSTGKTSPAATLGATLVMLHAVRDFAELTGDYRGVKSAGGIRTAENAIQYLVVVNEIAGARWLQPDLFRFGASSLLGDLVSQARTTMPADPAETGTWR